LYPTGKTSTLTDSLCVDLCIQEGTKAREEGQEALFQAERLRQETENEKADIESRIIVLHEKEKQLAQVFKASFCADISDSAVPRTTQIDTKGCSGAVGRDGDFVKSSL